MVKSIEAEAGIGKSRIGHQSKEEYMTRKILPRNKLNKKYTWNSESVFPSVEAWEKEINQILESVPKIKQFQGRLSESPSVLLEALTLSETLISRAQIASMYAGFNFSVDSTNQQAAGMRSKGHSMTGQVASAVAFLQPEILAIGREKLAQWLSENSNLEMYKHSFDDLFRRQTHVRSAEVEEILGLVSEPLGGASSSTGMLTNADFKFKTIKDGKGKVIEVSQENFDSELKYLPDRKARRAA